MLCAASLLSFALCQTPQPVSPPTRAEPGATAEGTPRSQDGPKLRPIGRRIFDVEPILQKVEAGAEADAARPYDADKMVARIAALGCDACVFRLDDKDRRAELNRFLPKARAAGLGVWVTVRLPMQRANSAPHLGDYERWAADVARMARSHDNLVAMLLPELDFGRNPRFVFPALVGKLRKTLNAAGVNLVATLYEPALDEGLDLDTLDGVVALWAHPRDPRGLETFLSGARTKLPDGRAFLGGLWLGESSFGVQLPEPARLTGLLRAFLRRCDGAYLGGIPIDALDNEWRKRLVDTGDLFRADRERPADGKQH